MIAEQMFLFNRGQVFNAIQQSSAGGHYTLKEYKEMRERLFKEIRKPLGFGMMRLPMKDDAMDNASICSMVDAFISGGFNYFDTAHGYHSGMSELAVRECLTSRHPRESYVLTDKLTEEYFKTEEDIRPFFRSQLERCGVDYFDFYLMHSQNAVNFEHFRKCRAYETAFELRDEGLVHHVGISFHDKAEVLDRILTAYPEIEVVQIQFNYLDYEDLSVEGRKVYETARRHGKPVFVMEPVRGGNLVQLPEGAQQIFDELRERTGAECSNAAYAVRFAGSFDGVEAVLSGMSTMEQLEDNMNTMREFVPLNDEETAAALKAAEALRGMGTIPCTACRYCIEENVCPADIRIPSLFSAYNRRVMFNRDEVWATYDRLTEGHGRASDCIGCGGCETVCPQHLDIRKLLTAVTEKFEQRP